MSQSGSAVETTDGLTDVTEEEYLQEKRRLEDYQTEYIASSYEREPRIPWADVRGSLQAFYTEPLETSEKAWKNSCYRPQSTSIPTGLPPIMNDSEAERERLHAAVNVYASSGFTDTTKSDLISLIEYGHKARSAMFNRSTGRIGTSMTGASSAEGKGQAGPTGHYLHPERHGRPGQDAETGVEAEEEKGQDSHGEHDSVTHMSE
ncbi:hypothetical protein BD324DRAFT_651404 [Kockovaella imperatae]|uniref:Uncharacterized protein n=1 Tax=Kockovaella imperatae TaxID=4999 RepID=A0A1Y1UG31_9TREE|nr:hypothetical protein BD324DRAFT_651404 [Kockovaella imperatae]ORX36929.1 hypothetical protein BD324DRAFT_651404 [Kockovaella imperatae]